MIKKLPSTKQLHTLFLYDTETGVLCWRNNKGRASAGSVAGNTRPDGYVSVRINSELFLAHRVIWKMCHTKDPVNQIDHINGNKSDNRINNLRDVSNKENNYNKVKCNSNNKVGLAGVCKKGKKFSSRISVDGKYIALGVYNTKEDAYSAYIKAKSKLHPPFGEHSVLYN